VEAGEKYDLYTIPFVAMVPTHKIAIVKQDGKIILHEAPLYPPKTGIGIRSKKHVRKQSSLRIPEFVYPLKR
jgi:hypothetical protein